MKTEDFKKIIDKAPEKLIREFLNKNALELFFKWDEFINSFNLAKTKTEEEINLAKEKSFINQLNSKQIIFPNAKVNKPYKHEFKAELFGDFEIGKFWFEGLEQIGLEFNNDTNEIFGTPNKAGDHKINLFITLKGFPTENRPPIQREILLIVNPDPRSLWKDIPTPKDIEYFKDDYASDYIKVTSQLERGYNGTIMHKVPQKDIVVASQRGRSHAHEGRARDDDFNVFFCEKTSWYILAVADGAGSAIYSRRGSRIACESVLDTCKNKLETDTVIIDNLIAEYNNEKSDSNRKKVSDSIYHIIGEAAFKAHKAIEKEAIEKPARLKDYATTLLLSICKKYEFGWFVASFWVGDGGIGLYNKETQFIKIMGEPDGGEFAGQTRFLTMPDIFQNESFYRRIRFEIIQDFTALFLMSDGVTDPKFETDANLNNIEKWNDLWDDLTKEVDLKDDNHESQFQLLKWLDFWSQGNHDDRTIAILY